MGHEEEERKKRVGLMGGRAMADNLARGHNFRQCFNSSSSIVQLKNKDSILSRQCHSMYMEIVSRPVEGRKPELSGQINKCKPGSRSDFPGWYWSVTGFEATTYLSFSTNTTSSR
jgi:hypothetical protein